jgi:hypothetical protein
MHPVLDSSSFVPCTKQFISFITPTKQERAVKWWNPAAQIHPVLDSSSFVPCIHASPQNLPPFCF